MKLKMHNKRIERDSCGVPHPNCYTVIIEFKQKNQAQKPDFNTKDDFLPIFHTDNLNYLSNLCQ